MTTTALAKKLLVKPGHRVAVINAPAGYAELLRPLPEGAELVDPSGSPVDVVQVFLRDSAQLERDGPAAVKAMKPDGLLWACYPKGGKKAGTDLNRDILWDLMGKQSGLVGVTLIAVDDTWSAMRFRAADKVGT
jgi:hypothetical protein